MKKIIILNLSILALVASGCASGYGIKKTNDAIELNDDDKHSGYLNAGDFQLYSIRVAQHSIVSIEQPGSTGNKSSDNIAIYLNVYSNDDDDVFVTSEGVNYLTFYAGAGKTYFIRITGSSSDISGAYNITVRISAVPLH